MKRILSLIYISVFISIAGYLYSGPLGVAVINFSNQTGSEGLSYLSTALPDSISATLSQLEEIQIVERAQLGKILEEIELELSGILDEKELSHVGELARAEVLLLGSFSGDPKEVVLTLKAVEVDTAEVLYGRVIMAPLSDLFDMANQAALVFGAIIAGKDIGSLSVSTDPEECDIYIDGMLVGVSPLVEYKLPAGSHRIKAIKAGYTEQETTMSIVPDEHARWRTALVELRSKYPWELAGGAMYLQPLNHPLTVQDIKPGFLGFVSFGYAFGRFAVSGQYEVSGINHNDSVSSLWGTIEQKRWYIMNSLKACLTFVPFPDLKWVSPYVGLLAGGSLIFDIMGDRENRTTFPPMIGAVVGPKIGVYLFPFLRTHLFLEGQFYIHSHKLRRTTYESRGLAGSMKSTISEYTSCGFSLGGGLRLKL